MLIIKKIIIIIMLLLVILPYNVFGDDNVSKSYFVEPIDVICDYPLNEVNKFAVTCRVWGLLKYFHPNVTAGKLDWDKVLIGRLIKIKEAKTAKQVNAELMQMIRIAGKYEVQKDNTWNDSLNMNVNLCWLDNSFINNNIRQILREIASLTVTNHWYYLEYGMNTPNNEKDYPIGIVNVPFEYSMLALFRYWNVIYYFFPYKYLMDQSWDETLSEFIPIFQKTTLVSDYHKNIQKLTSRLNDGHGFTSHSIGQVSAYTYQPNPYLTLIDSSTVVRNPPEGSMMKGGDIILKINGEAIQSLKDSITQLIPSSNKRFEYNIFNGHIFDSMIRKGCELTVMRNQQVITFYEPMTKRSDTTVISLTTSNPISSDIYYLNLSKFKMEDWPILDSLNSYKGVIIDMRNGYPPLNMWPIYHFFQTQEFCYGMATQADFSHLGAFYKKENITRFPDELWKERKEYTGKKVLLINEMIMSAGETWAMSFRLNGFTLIGTPTAGANGNIVSLPLPGYKLNAYFSGLGWYYPNGEQMQRTGIIPDIEVYTTMDDIMEGRDEVLDAAIKYLNLN